MFFGSSPFSLLDGFVRPFSRSYFLRLNNRSSSFEHKSSFERRFIILNLMANVRFISVFRTVRLVIYIYILFSFHFPLNQQLIFSLYPLLVFRLCWYLLRLFLLLLSSSKCFILEHSMRRKQIGIWFFIIFSTISEHLSNNIICFRWFSPCLNPLRRSRFLHRERALSSTLMIAFIWTSILVLIFKNAQRIFLYHLWISSFDYVINLQVLKLLIQTRFNPCWFGLNWLYSRWVTHVLHWLFRYSLDHPVFLEVFLLCLVYIYILYQICELLGRSYINFLISRWINFLFNLVLLYNGYILNLWKFLGHLARSSSLHRSGMGSLAGYAPSPYSATRRRRVRLIDVEEFAVHCSVRSFEF